MDVREFTIRGKVQGVGFRHFTVNAAAQWDIRGEVKNMPDGSVHCIAMGEPQNMAGFIKALHQGPSWGRVDSVDETQLDAAAHSFSAFRVTY